MKPFFLIFFFLTIQLLWAQHEPKAWIIGLQANTSFASPEKLGGNFQLNYAHNCYTTVINEVSVFPYENQTALEVASSVNLIINNFKRQNFILTGGIGLSVTSVELTDKELKNAFLALSSNTNQNHLGVLFKIKGLYQFKPYWNFVTSLNLKTLGSDFVNISMGINYEFPYRR